MILMQIQYGSAWPTTPVPFGSPEGQHNALVHGAFINDCSYDIQGAFEVLSGTGALTRATGNHP